VLEAGYRYVTLDLCGFRGAVTPLTVGRREIGA
jgi:hypothetical protein